MLALRLILVLVTECPETDCLVRECRQVFSTPAGKLRRIPGIGEVLAKR
jgi:hypothetical protein